MPVFRVGIRETQTVFYDVEADNEEDALEMVDNGLNEGEPVWISGPFEDGDAFITEKVSD